MKKTQRAQVQLTNKDRQLVAEMLRRGRESARVLRRASILRQLDQGQKITQKLSYFRDKARRAKLDFEVILIQPGASIASITDDALRLVATTELYLLKTTQANFRIVLSA
jgi:hypothetical protein